MQAHSDIIDFCGKKIPWEYVTNPQEAALICINLLEKDTLFAIDTETAPLPQYLDHPKAGLSPHLSRIRLIQLYDGEKSYVFDMDTVGNPDIFIPFLEAKRFIAHNAIFDLKFFMRMGVKQMNIACTRILYKLISHAVYPTDSGLSASLDGLSNAVLKTPISKKVQVSNWNEPDLTFEQIEYAALDPVACYMIAERIGKGLGKFGLEEVYKLTKEAQYPLAEMQLNGLGLDIEKHQTKIHIWRDELYSAKKALMNFLGSTEIKDSIIRNWLEKNLDEYTLMIWPRTEGGENNQNEQLSVSAHTFVEFSYLPIVAPLAIYKKLEKLSSTYGDTLLNLINPATGKLHADYNLCGARTGRLSSSRPNLQQYPNDKELRSHFIPSPGNLFVCADYSQIEVRIAAEISGDEEMLSIYRQGLDIYSATAAHLTGRSIESIRKDSIERKVAKALVLGLLFGLGAEKFSHYAKKGYGVDISYQDALANIKRFREVYPGLRAWQLEQSKQCGIDLKAVTIGGKVRKLAPDNYYGPGLNMPIQGTAAEIVLRSLNNIYCYTRETPIKLVNCVHDENLLECPPEITDNTVELVRWCMVDAFKQSFPNGITNKLVNIWVGDNWGAGKD